MQNESLPPTPLFHKKNYIPGNRISYTSGNGNLKKVLILQEVTSRDKKTKKKDPL